VLEVHLQIFTVNYVEIFFLRPRGGARAPTAPPCYDYASIQFSDQTANYHETSEPRRHAVEMYASAVIALTRYTYDLDL